MFNSETSLEEPLLMLKIYGLLIPGVFHSGGWNSFKVVTQRRGGTLFKVASQRRNSFKVVLQRRVELFKSSLT